MSFPDLKNKVALVTGGANGIGAATVRAFHAQGTEVCFCDLDETAGETLAASLGGRAHFKRVNLSVEEEIVSWVRDAERQFGQIHVLVNNAAADPRIPLFKTSAQQWDELFARNLRAYFLAAREAAKLMPPDRGSIINLSSITFHTAPTEMTAYVATKAGIIGFTRALARELGPLRIRVNTVSPGWVMTERQLAQYVNEETKALIRRSQCVPELLQPGEIANVILFLASEISAAVTGQEILADRGWAHS